MSLSNCMQIVQDLPEADAEALISKVDTYQAAGMSPKDASRLAVKDMMAELAADRKATLKQIKAAVSKPGQNEEARRAGLPTDQGEVDVGGTLASQDAEDFFLDSQIADMKRRSVVKASKSPGKPGPADGGNSEPPDQVDFAEGTAAATGGAAKSPKGRGRANPPSGSVKQEVAPAEQTYTLDRVPQEQRAARLAASAAAFNDRIAVLHENGWHDNAEGLANLRDEIKELVEDDGKPITGASMARLVGEVGMEIPAGDRSAALQPLVPLSDEDITNLGKELTALVGDTMVTEIAPVLNLHGEIAAAAGANSVNNDKEFIGIATLFAGLDLEPHETPYTNALQTVHHEAMHSVVTQLIHNVGIESVQPLIDAVKQQHIIDQLVALTTNKTMRDYYTMSPEEALAQAYAYWAVGKLHLKATPRLKGFFNQVKALVKRILQILSGDELLAEAFASLKRGEARRASLPGDATLDTFTKRQVAGFLNYAAFHKKQALDAEWAEYEGREDVAFGELKRIVGEELWATARATLSPKVLENLADDVGTVLLSDEQVVEKLRSLLWDVSDEAQEAYGDMWGDEPDAPFKATSAKPSPKKRAYSVSESADGFKIIDDESGEWVGDERDEEFGADETTGYFKTRGAAQKYVDYLNTKKHSLYEGRGGLDLNTEEGREEARRRIREIAGNVGIHFGTENSYDPEGHVITLAVSGFADLGTAYHEALHAVFKAIDPNDKATLYAGLNTMAVRKQLKELLRDSPDALKAALNDSEELAAYAFQFYKRGMLRLGPETQTWFDKLIDMIEKAKNWLLDQPGAQELMQRVADGYYADGGPSPVELAALRDAKGPARRILTDVARGLVATYDRLLSAVDDRLRNSGVSELGDIAKEFYTQVGEQTGRRGMAQEIPIMTNLWMNELAKAIGSDPAAAARALEAMALGDSTSPKAQEFRRFLNKIRNYMKQAGADIGFIEGYLPMQWSGDKIADDEDGFTAMLGKYSDQLKKLDLTPQKVWEMMSQRNISSAIPTGDVFDETGKPTMWHTQERVFSFLSAEDRRPYVEDNLIGTMGQYVKQAVKRAEWERRFPGNSWEQKLEAARKRNAKDEDIALAKDLKEAVFGAKYNRMNPTWRKALGAMQTYQNVRVLGLALFSSVADPLVLGVRSGDFKEAWGAFKYGFRHLYKMPKDDLAKLAEDIGVINEIGNLDSLMTLYGGFEVEGNLKHVNDMLFKYNGLEGLTRGLRVYATGAATRFIPRASKRALSELGLKPEDLKYMPDGTLAVRSAQFKELGMANKDAANAALQMQRALNRFVDESVLRPNAAERPKWANDPIFALLFHLKQFIFSFHKIVGKKVMHEIEEGNTDPAMYLSAAAFVPMMAATGYVKDIVKFAGEVPVDRDFMYYLTQGINRSGFVGPSILAGEASADVMAGRNPLGGVGGPTASQGLEALQAFANPEKFGRFVEEAMPLSSVYKDWVK